MEPTVRKVQTFDGRALALGCYPAKGEGPIALILHGLYSHMGWYADLARSLSERGVPTYLMDRRGAGISEGERGHMHAWRHSVDDLVRVVSSIRAEHPGRALDAVGVSLGGVMTLAAALLDARVFRQQVVLSIGLAPARAVSLRQKLQLARRSLRRPASSYELPFGAEQLSHHPDWRKALWDDPLRTREVTARFLTETFRMQSFVRLHIARLRTPVLALLSERDEMVDNRVTLSTLRRARRTCVRVEIFEGASHVLPACVPSEQLIGRIHDWMMRDASSLGPGFEVRRTAPFEHGSAPPALRASAAAEEVAP